MFKLYNKFHKKKKIEIPQDDFPDDILCSIMNNYLKIYLSYKNSSTPNDKNMHKDELFHRLKQFQNFNPTFGRTYIYRRMKKRSVKYDDKHIKFNEYSRIGLHNAHIEKIQFPQYVSISANNDNNYNETGTGREEFFNIFRNVLNNRQNNITSNIQTPIIDLSINQDTSPFFFRFDLSNNTVAPSDFVYRTPSPEHNEIIDASDNYFDAFYDNESSSTDDTNSIPPLIDIHETPVAFSGEAFILENDDQTVVFDSDDDDSMSDSNA